jgi:hypothetical protein
MTRRLVIVAVAFATLVTGCGGGSKQAASPSASTLGSAQGANRTACDQIRDIRAKVFQARSDLAAGKIEAPEALRIASNQIARVSAVAASLPLGQFRSDVEAWGREWAAGTDRPEYKAAQAKVYPVCGITPEPSSITGSASSAPTTLAVSDARPATSKFIHVQGDITVPDGEPSKLSVVVIGRPGQGSVPVVVRNRTGKSLAGIDVAGTARDASGALIASGSSQGFVPENVKPGEWAFGYVFFGTEDLPGDAKFELAATGKEPDSHFGSIDLLVKEVTTPAGDFGGMKIVGILANPTAQEVKGPVSVDTMCFDGATPIFTSGGFADADSVAADGTTSFSLNLPSDVACGTFAVGGSGHSF